ncbi:MAG TPA: hypothetical protein VKT21_05780 [Thermoplasmata archaeon]|nr:hypothetical protein [Thermoplasmata archaeon]
MVRSRAGEPAVLIAYRVGRADATRLSRFQQKVFGSTTSTRGKRYHRTGAMEAIPHWRVTRGVLVVRARDREQVVDLLRKWVAEIHWWGIALSPQERRRVEPPR